MEYKFCSNENFEDFASGRVIYGNRGIPNFPVRLINEIFGRCVSYSDKKSDLTIYDPCCGGGYSLTVLGLCNNDVISEIIGSDIDIQMVEYAKKNLELLSQAGLQNRMDEIEGMYNLYEKSSHRDALESAKRMKHIIKREKSIEIFQADCTTSLSLDKKVDIIITDVPYGNLVDWKCEEDTGINAMMRQLAKIANSNTVLGISMDKHEKVSSNEWKKCEKNIIGKRKFEIYKIN